MTQVQEEPLIGDEARAFIGKVTHEQEGIVVKKEFQRWAAAVKDRNPLYFDADFARAHGYRAIDVRRGELRSWTLDTPTSNQFLS